MAEDQKLATLIRGDEKRIVGVDTPEAQQAFGEGFKLPKAPSIPEAPVVATQEAPVVNRGALEGQIKETLGVAGVLDKQANPEFINAAFQLAQGRDANEGELATGGEFGLGGATVRDVVGRLGLGRLAPAMGLETAAVVETPEGVAAEETTVVEAPKSALEKTQELLSGFGEQLSGARAEAGEQVGLTARSQAIADAQTKLNDLRTTIANQQIIDVKELDEIGDKVIPNVFIRAQQADLSREQKLDLMISQNEFNNAQVDLQIAQGNFDRAQEFVQQTADDKFQSLQFQLEALETEGIIEKEEADSLRRQAENERDLMLQGFTPISPEQAKDLRPGELFTDPVTGKNFLRPVTPVDEVGFETRTIGNQIVRVNPDGTATVIFQGEEGDDPLTLQEKFKNTFKIRNDFQDDSKEFVSVQNAYNRVKASVDEPSAAGDLALIFNYMKMLDPGSVVRESEFANAAASGSLGERFIAAGKKLESGERLSDNMRKDFTARAKKLFATQKSSQERRQEEFRRTASDFKLDPNTSVPDLIEKEPVFSNIQDFINNASDDQAVAFDELQDKFPAADDVEILDLINEQLMFESGFNSVGDDTDKVSTTEVNIGGKNFVVADTISNKLENANREMVKETGIGIKISEAFRTTERQKQLFDELSKKGAQVAPPGTSFHEKGLAVDVVNWKEAEPFLRKFGLINDLPNDRGHFSFGEFS